MPIILLTPAQQAKKKKGFCITPLCRNKPTAKKNKCSKCAMRKYAVNRPLRYKYNNLKIHARHRNIPFELTFEQFEKLATETGYSVKSGIRKRSYQIDRIDSQKGYTLENCRVITASANGKKGATIDKAAYAEARANGVTAVDAFASCKQQLVYDADTYTPDLETGF